MSADALQVEPAETLAMLHDAAIRLGDMARDSFSGDWRAGLEPAPRAAATIAALAASTQLMEAMSWLLTRQAVLLGETPEPLLTVWRARTPDFDALRGDGRELAKSIDRLYRHIVELEGER